MTTEKLGKVIKGLGGLYETRVETEDGIEIYSCRAKGNLRRDEEKLLIGDNVKITIDTDTPDGIVISDLLPRKNALIRPPMANLDYLFIVFAAAKPAPVLETVDKLIAIAEHNGISPAVVVTKSDVDTGEAEKLRKIYDLSDIPAFVTSASDGDGLLSLSEYIKSNVRDGKTAAFAGASGVGKSTLMNALFPSLSLATAEISKKIQRGKHTTRHVEIFEIEKCEDTGFLADTPGFSLIDFERFDFLPIESLAQTFRDIVPYVGKCRYADCAHVGEGSDECAVARAALEGELSESRLSSYRAIYRALKQKNKYT